MRAEEAIVGSVAEQQQQETTTTNRKRSIANAQRNSDDSPPQEEQPPPQQPYEEEEEEEGVQETEQDQDSNNNNKMDFFCRPQQQQRKQQRLAAAVAPPQNLPLETATLPHRPGATAAWWEALPEAEQWNKANVLAVLVAAAAASASSSSSSTNATTTPTAAAAAATAGALLPEALTEAGWDIAAPAEMCHDRDLMLARLARGDFAQHYRPPSSRAGHNGNPNGGGTSPSAKYYKPAFALPPALLMDKEVVVAAVHRCPDLLCQDDFAPEYFDDADVFAAYLRSFETPRPPRDAADGDDNHHDDNHNSNIRECSVEFPLVLLKFSTAVRGDAALMLAAAALPPIRVSGAAVWAHFADDDAAPPSLARDVSFALGLAIRLGAADCLPDFFLQRFAGPVLDDRAVVLECVRRNGLSLAHASAARRGDADIVRAACLDNAVALTYYCPPLRLAPAAYHQTGLDDLGADKAFLLDVLGRLERRGEGGHPELYRLASPALQRDADVAAAAHDSHNLRIMDLPAEFLVPTAEAHDDDNESRAFWLGVIARSSPFWLHLPAHWADDDAFARAIQTFATKELAALVFQRFPHLATDRAAWAAVVRSFAEWNPGTADLIRDHAPALLKNDRELMTQACAREARVLDYLGDDLALDRAVLQATLRGCLYALPHLSEAAQRLHPDLAAEGIYRLRAAGEDVNYYSYAVAGDLWPNLVVADAWFRCGGRLHEGFPEWTKDNQPFGLLLAELRGGVDDFSSGVSTALRGDKAFMLQAVQKNSLTLLCASSALKRDCDVVMAAFGAANSSAVSLATRVFPDGSGATTWKDLLKPGLLGLMEHEKFLHSLLASLAPSTAGTVEACPLQLLVSGSETTLALKNLIAEYLGTPTGPALVLLRQTRRNLVAGAVDFTAELVAAAADGNATAAEPDTNAEDDGDSVMEDDDDDDEDDEE